MVLHRLETDTRLSCPVSTLTALLCLVSGKCKLKQPQNFILQQSEWLRSRRQLTTIHSEDVGDRSRHPPLADLTMVWSLWKSVWRTLKIELPYDPAILLLGTNPKDSISYYQDTCSAVFLASLFTIVRKQNQPKCPSTSEWTTAMWSVCVMELHSTVKKNEILKLQVSG